MCVMLPLLFLFPLLAKGGETPQTDLGVNRQPIEDVLRGEADEKIMSQLNVRSAEETTNKTWPQQLNFTDSAEKLIASMTIGNTISIDLANTTCSGVVEDGKCCQKKEAGDKCVPAPIVADKGTAISFTLDGEMIPSATSKGGDNGTDVLTLSIKFQDMKTTNKTPPGLQVTAAEITVTVNTQGDTRKDYWNVTSATLALTGSLNGSALPESSDITSKSGYSGIYPACTSPYTPCAPTGLSWTCTDQVFAPTSSEVNKIGLGKHTVKVHIPGWVLQLGNSTMEQYNWDCDPLIPISVWVSVLVTLFLATLLMWGICMLATLQTPSKFDDPKGPSIHVPTAE